MQVKELIVRSIKSIWCGSDKDVNCEMKSICSIGSVILME